MRLLKISSFGLSLLLVVTTYIAIAQTTSSSQATTEHKIVLSLLEVITDGQTVMSLQLKPFKHLPAVTSLAAAIQKGEQGISFKKAVIEVVGEQEKQKITITGDEIVMKGSFSFKVRGHGLVQVSQDGNELLKIETSDAFIQVK